MAGWAQAIRGIGKGIAGLFPQEQTTSTSGSSTTNSGTDTNSNYNTYSNQDISNLINTINNIIAQQQTQGTATTTPNLSPATQQFLDKLVSRYEDTAVRPFDARGYEASQSQNINRNADIASQSANNMMASRGLAFSPASATTAAGIDADRFRQQQQLSAGIPMLSNQMNLQNLGAAASFLNMIPKGSTTSTLGSTSSSQQQTGQQQGQQTGSQTGGGTSYQQNTGYQNTNQQQVQKSKSGGGLGGFLSGLFGGG